MNVTGIIQDIDGEIQKLQAVRQTLAGLSGEPVLAPTISLQAVAANGTRRPMSPEARKRISEAVKARHAANKKASKR